MNILVIDVGTSGMRGTVVSEDGVLGDTKKTGYRPAYLEGGVVEQDPRDWENALTEICSFAADKGIEAVSITSQRSSVIPMGKDGRPLGKAMMWQDTRHSEMCEDFKKENGRIAAVCGAGVNTVFSGIKMSWFRKNRPDEYLKIEKFFVIPDYLIFLMTGERVSDHTYGSRSLLMDIRKREWSREMLELFEVEEKTLCRLISPSSTAGYVTRDFSKKTGLKEGIPVISAGGDQQCGALGQGVYDPGRVSVNLGTGGFLIAASGDVPDTDLGGIICNAAAVPDQFILESDVLACGSAINWFLSALCPGETAELCNEVLKNRPIGSNGVICLPFFQGRSDPYWDGDARASFYGVSLSTSREDMLRALLEGIACEVSRHIKSMERFFDIDLLCAGGGLTDSPYMCSLLADACGKRLAKNDVKNPTVVGAYMSALVCLKKTGDFKTAFETVMKNRKTAVFEPDPENGKILAEIGRKAERLYISERSVFKENDYA